MSTTTAPVWTLDDADAETYLALGIRPAEVLRLRWPSLGDQEADWLLWERTPFPVVRGLHDIADAVADITPVRHRLSRQKGYRLPDGVINVARPSRWGNPFRYHTRETGLVRYRPDRPDTGYEFESRISGPDTRHDFYHPGGEVTRYEVRWATYPELVELFRRTLLDPDRGMRMGYPSGHGNYTNPGRGKHPITVADIRRHLAGRDLACWCPASRPCHADILMEIANA